MFILGYLSKSSILPFLVVAPLVLYFFTDMKLKNFILIFGGLIVALIVAYYGPRLFISRGLRVNSFIENPLYFEKSFWIRTGTALMSLLFYLKMLVFPYPMRFYYGYNMIPMTNWANIWVILSFLLYAAMLIWAVRKFREKHILSFSIFLYLLFIAMYSNILVPVPGIVGERFLFAASLGFIIALVYLIFYIVRTNPKSLTIEFDQRAKIIVIVFLLLIPATAMTIARNRSWRNVRDLYRADITKLDNSAKANADYAQYLVSTIYEDPNYQQYGKVNEFKQQTIVGHFRRSLELYPINYQVLNDLATVYLRFTDKTDSAVYFLKKAMAITDTLQPAWVNLALAYRKLGKPDSALIFYQRILQKNPKEMNAYFKIADIYFEKGDMAKAISMNEEVMRQQPDLHIPYFNIGSYYFMKGDTITAVRYWEQSFQKKPTYEAALNLYNMYRLKADNERTNFYYQAAMEARKNSAPPQE
jgi:Tfp pilus assembly protein PilF